MADLDYDDDDLRQFDVFISHRAVGVNQLLARTLAARLEEVGLRCFLDTKDISSGDSFIKTILSGVRRCRLVIVLFTEDVSSWLHFEASVAFFDESIMAFSMAWWSTT